MIRNARTRVRIACFFLALLIIQGLIPSVSWALTSGPAQPETKKFMQAGTSDMVDLSTGDFKYNIPLLDIDGYPVNLNYQSGAGMDDEASWVGLGWSLNTGAINRQIRGVADDSYGDTVLTENDMKRKVTVGGTVNVRGEIFGNGLGGTVSVGIFSDNYTGIGAEVGLNIGQKLTDGNSSSLTLGLGINSNTSEGVTFSPSLSLSGQMSDRQGAGGGLSINASYNSREGLKGLTLGASFNALDITSSFSFNTPTFYPKPAMTFKSSNTTFSADFGPGAFGGYLGYGIKGYMSKRTVNNALQANRAYGFMYAENGKFRDDVLTDFMREKEAAVVPKMQMLPLPVATPDIFSYTSQTGSGQFKAVRHSTGAFYDSKTTDYSDNASISYEYGSGGIFHTGISVYLQDITTASGRWHTDNFFLPNGDFSKTESLGEEQVYFKQTGEKGMEDPTFVNRIQGEEAVRVPLNGKTAMPQLKADGKSAVGNTELLKKNGRQLRQSPITYLTAEQAAEIGLEKRIRSYKVNDVHTFSPAGCAEGGTVTFESRSNGHRKPKHISEITVNETDGKRLVYGIPVYNKSQTEYTYSADASEASAEQKEQGLIPIKKTGDKINYKPTTRGVEFTDQYFHREKQPGYATSYLLTGILSPDYIDVKGDGITDDDRGTAIRFKYSKIDDGTDNADKYDYRWRTPARKDMAQFNPGLAADPADDKASFVFGEKELWYLHSIESKTKVAYFITDVRDDALGLDSMGNKETRIKQRVLKEIRLYSKSDLTRPIKTVKLEHDYTSLCKNVLNTKDEGQGKLTLKSLYFTYGTSTKGESHKYTFGYNAVNPDYAERSTDRWGTYKGRGDNAVDGMGNLKNDLYPYSLQDKTKADANAGAWQLSEIGLPTGGKINVQYESDDYAFVQDKRAATMQGIYAMYKEKFRDQDPYVQTSNLLEAKYFEIQLPKAEGTDLKADLPKNDADFINRFLGGSQYMYVKMFVCMSDIVDSDLDASYDFVPCYVKFKKALRVDNTNRRVLVEFEDDVDDQIKVNPIASAAWQRMRVDYPIYAYPGYKNRIGPDRPIAAAIGALANSVKNLSEILENFNERAFRKNFAFKVKLDKSFARLGKANGHKRGGGARVKRIKLSDEWNTMTGGEAGASYGQEYDYTITDGKQTISSGVAAYEPSVGGDENMMRQPVIYEQRAGVGLNNVFYQEEPAGESFYPAPSVVYREVKVRNLNENGVADPNNKTGWLSYEFYTAKEFPVIVDRTELEKNKHQPFPWLLFFGGRSVSELTMSQGYSIVVNDMHGKPKAERIFNQSGQEISSTEYQYAATEEGQHLRLNNKVDVVDAAGVITKDQVIGREIEMFADMRESETRNIGKNINPGIDVFAIGIFTIPLLHGPIVKNEDYRLFRSSCLTKVVQYYGVVKGVIKKVNGASTTASNVLFDKYTGQPVLVQGENEFKDPVYTLTVPAYWIYNKMGLSYQNLGMILENFDVDDNAVPLEQFKPYLTAGDELIDVADHTTRAWVVSTALNGTGEKALRVIDEDGRLKKSLSGTMRVYRSGYRNQLGAAATTITSLTNPVVDNKLKFISNVDLSGDKIINATAVLFDEAWGQAADCNYKTCPEGFEERLDGLCYKTAPVNPNFKYSIRFPGISPAYGKQGAHFYNFGDPNRIGESSAEYWKKRLDNIGIWLDGLPGNRWWGAEKMVNLTTDQDVFIGHAGTKRVRIWIDDLKFVEYAPEFDVQIYEIWHLVKYRMTAGKHRIRVEAWADNDGMTVGAEIYTTDMNTLAVGSETAIKPATIFSTADLKGDPYVYLYELDESGNPAIGNYVCPDGERISVMNGYPDCGSREKGSCPPGYEKSADGQMCIPIGTENTDAGLVLKDATDLPEYSQEGATFYDENNNVVAVEKSPFWGTNNCTGSGGSRTTSSFSNLGLPGTTIMHTDTGDVVKYTSSTSTSKSVTALASSSGGCGRLNASGVWLSRDYTNKWIGFNSCLSAPESKTYYIGMGVDNQMRVYIDGKLWKEILSDGTNTESFVKWKVFPCYLPAGNHIITIEAMEIGTHGVSWSVGLEVYNNTLAELRNGNVNIIYSTGNLVNGKPKDTYVKNAAGVIEIRRYPCPPTLMDLCGDNLGCTPIAITSSINPYLTGFLGNWLPYKQMAWLSSRSGQELLTTSKGSTNVRQGGYFKNFKAFWIYNNGWSMSGDNDWVTATTSTLYDKYSQELENKDALNHYSSAKYGFRSALPVAVGVNARQREIFYDGFDDYQFNNNKCDDRPCEPDEFSIQKIVGTNYEAKLSADDAHSGNHSYRLSEKLDLKTYLFRYEHAPGIYLNINKLGEYYRNTQEWLGLRGFCPVNDRKYVFSVWVKDGSPTTSSVNITLKVNGQNVELVNKAIVEGWKLIEGEINFSTNAPAGDVVQVPVVLEGTGSGILIDDIRIFPFDGQLKTYTYDDHTMRVMAEMDENNYATFYEYDDEGSLVRVKKETERGIMTIKESRSAYLKKTN
ncbi:hypothetical protein C7475_1011212 [Chitinophaga sp. S165]|nr:hypothetical protein C7475_1011212 [Chitinophaga sp. S165]